MVQQSTVSRLPIRLTELLAVLAFLGVLVVAVASWPARGGGRPPSGIEQVYIMNADGTGVRPVSPDLSVRHATPAWSPDGRHLVMSVGGGEDFSEPAHLWILDLDTGETRQLTHGNGRDHLPAWSPDGSTIVFITHDLPMGSAPSTLYSIRPDGTGLMQLTDGRSGASPASWSPDSKQLVFGTDREGPLQLYVTNADGSEPRRLEAGVHIGDPAWSPDGRTIAFTSGAGVGEIEVHTYDLQTQETRQLTDTLAFDGLPDWSPDGSKIVFISERSRHPEVYTMNADGSDQKSLTSISGFHGIRAKWSPDGSKIVFFGLFDPPGGEK